MSHTEAFQYDGCHCSGEETHGKHFRLQIWWVNRFFAFRILSFFVALPVGENGIAFSLKKPGARARDSGDCSFDASSIRRSTIKTFMTVCCLVY